jgi:hypothetical protein
MILTLNDKLSPMNRSINTKSNLISRLENIKTEYDKNDYTKKILTQDLFYIEDNIETEYSQKNLLEYLCHAWDSHLGIVITPDMIWYSLQCELAGIVSSKTETYRNLFTTSEGKQEIVIQSDSLTVMPLDRLMNTLKSKIPSDISNFIPEFSTSNERSAFAKFAAFCDMVSPYYNYSMFCCGFPAINVKGEVSDWQKLYNCWKEIGKLFKEDKSYIDKVDSLLDRICRSLNDVDFWKKMFSLEKCGSGSQYTVSGWINDIYYKIPEFNLPNNYPSHISIVKYKQLDIGKNYEMKQGLISSKIEDGFLVPDFAYIIYEKGNEKVTEVRVSDEIKIYISK